MKRLSPILFIVICYLVTACAQLTGKKRELVVSQSESAATLPAPALVPKSQYDQLLSKYEALLKQSKESEQSNAQVDLGEQEVVSPKTADTSKSIATGNSDGQSVELVAAINDTVEIPPSATPTPTPEQKGGADLGAVEKQIQILQTATQEVDQNKFESALVQLKNLEKSPVRQIVVRAKYLMGEILFKQQEYDLAMQIYEEIINKFAFSGVVLKTLERLIICSEKLKLTKKRELYYSILHDFFESNT